MDNMFAQIDFGPVKEYLENDDVTDISYSNNGQLWLKTLSRGIFRIENEQVNNAFMEKLAFQCSNAMGKSFNMAHPFLDAESAELRLNFVHDSIAKNGIAVVMRKTPAKIRLQKEKIIEDRYIELDIHDFLIQCVLGHCNIIVCGETGSGKTEFVKYLAAHTVENEKIITIEDTLELHLDRIFPHRDIVAMKTNNIAAYSDVLVTCMRQNPKWILLSEVRSAEAVMAVRNSISSGHYILSTIHADKASSIPNRMYSLLETNQDIEQFLKSIYRYIQIGVYIRGYQDKTTKQFRREIAEVTEFYVTEDNKAEYNTIYKKTPDGKITRRNVSKYLLDYLEAQGVTLPKDVVKGDEEVKAAVTESYQSPTTGVLNAQTANVKQNDADVLTSEPVKSEIESLF
ncbi:MAG: Flp pilus assembly complex ATPase component TadA [Bacilli bacterium]|nr:Flp pilus assembly complex ATPase component TadA [Bacilli bacterium]